MEAGAGPEALVAGSAGVSLSNKTADWWWRADSAMYLTWADPVGTYLYKSMLFLRGTGPQGPFICNAFWSPSIRVDACFTIDREACY